MGFSYIKKGYLQMSEFYKNYTNSNSLQKCEELLTTLPYFCEGYIISTSRYNKPLTQLAYLQRLSVFFEWLHENNPYFKKKNITDISIDDMGLLKKSDIEEFLYHIDKYGALTKEEIKDYRAKDKIIIPTKAATGNNYISALNSLYNYFLDNEYLEKSPVARIRHKKETKRPVIALDDYQKDKFIQTIDYGSEFMTKKQNEFREKTMIRDRTIVILMARTGIRVSELVGLDIDDIDFRKNRFSVIRKRGKEEFVYFDDEVKNCLEEWLFDRETYHPVDDERALFITNMGKNKGGRMSVRSIQLLVKKYAVIGTPEIGEKFTPHKLRSTCATDIINKTGDINYAKNVLGHENITTTTRYILDNEKQKEENRNILIKD